MVPAPYLIIASAIPCRLELLERWGGAEVTTYTIVTNTGNHTLYAQWILDTYRITYRPGTHGTFGQEEYHVIYGPLSHNILYTTLYTFDNNSFCSLQFDSLIHHV